MINYSNYIFVLNTVHDNNFSKHTLAFSSSVVFFSTSFSPVCDQKNPTLSLCASHINSGAGKEFQFSSALAHFA